MKPKFMELAAAISFGSSKKEQIGAVIARKNRLISYGVNSHKTHPAQLFYNKKFRFKNNVGEPGTDISSIHAEMDALNRARGKNLKGNTLYVYRQMKSGKLAMCRPCKGCMQALRDYGIRKIVYTTELGVAVEKIL